MIVEALSDFWMIKRSGQIANNMKKMVSEKRQVSTKNCLRFVAARHLCVKCVFNEYFYKVVNIKKYEDGAENYTVEMYKGKLIDTVIDDKCNLYSVIKFKDEIIGVETRPSWWYLDDKYSYSLETQLKAYKYKYFDFSMPLKILTPQDNEEC